MASSRQSVEVEVLNLRQIAERIDGESRYLLGITGYDFVTRLKAGTLDYQDSRAQFYTWVRVWLNLANEAQHPKVIAKLRRLAEQDVEHHRNGRPVDAVGG